jgi:mitochondrial fission protein ELM1
MYGSLPLTQEQINDRVWQYFGEKVSERDPLVWCLLGRKAGDNTQVLALAQELGYGFREKHIRARSWELLVHLGSRPSLAGIDRAASTALEPPWPDLVITAGRRNEPVARWIRQRSGGLTRLVHLGRPWARLEEWDLVVTTPQYFLPRQANIHHNSLPLLRWSPGELAAAAQGLRPRIAELPRPWIALLVGGDSGQFVLTADKGRRLGTLADELARDCGGSLLYTDSPRTPAAAGDALQQRLVAPGMAYRWGRSEAGNPYRGLLALADGFVVTGESMSMLAEAAATGRPLFIFDMGDGETPWWRLRHGWRYKPLSHRFAMRFGPLRLRRDVGNIQRALVESGRASWLDEGSVPAAANTLRQGLEAIPDAASQAGANEELRQSAAAVRRLLTVR